MNIYVKKRGLNEFFLCNAEKAISNRGYKTIRLTPVTQISKYRYYKQPAENRIIYHSADTVIHEIGNEHLIKRLF